MITDQIKGGKKCVCLSYSLENEEKMKMNMLKFRSKDKGREKTCFLINEHS